ncbi:helix-turn-helix transcriptional regulator [Apilactobacillus xinyiensis]|uniref:helix-turn-helix transcriptional regulator n=1 Tax=Apilactobacillus xinyiensis TaxID=2841032 RepID=UPI00200D264E|nr:helix-turn-helix transcriptional regulator [Apilactobacillus xinyiensis]MCL0330808.1 helix-turn-helix domain-containing protein [Apilactobacillus xinyiensis]
MNIGKSIKSIRIINGFTQEQFSEILNYSCQTISNWERNISFPSITTILDISEKFDVPLDKMILSNNENDEFFKKKIFNRAIQLLKMNESLSIKNICKTSYFNIPELLCFFKNDSELFCFVIEECDRNIENKIMDIKSKDKCFKSFLLDLLKILYCERSILHLLYTSSDLSSYWVNYINRKYYKIYKDNFIKNHNFNELDFSLFITVLVDLIKNWLSSENIVSPRRFYLSICHIFNKNNFN